MALIKLVSDIPQLKCWICWDGYAETSVTIGLLVDLCTRDTNEFTEVSSRSFELHFYWQVASINIVFNRLKCVLLLILFMPIRDKGNRGYRNDQFSTSEATLKIKWIIHMKALMSLCIITLMSWIISIKRNILMHIGSKQLTAVTSLLNKN